MSQLTAGLEAGITDRAISHYEVGRVVPTPGMVRGLAVAYGATLEVAKDLGRLALKAGEPGWWEPDTFADKAGLSTLLDLDDLAESMCQISTEAIPGLLQTERYARSVLTSFPTTPDIEKAVALKLSRSERMWRRDDRPVMRFTITEGAIRRSIHIDPEQLNHLVRMAEQVDVRVIPDSAEAHAAMSGGFAIVRSRTEHVPAVVYTEAVSGSRYEENSDVVQAYQTVWDASTALSLDVRETSYGR